LDVFQLAISLRGKTNRKQSLEALLVLHGRRQAYTSTSLIGRLRV